MLLSALTCAHAIGNLCLGKDILIPPPLIALYLQL